MEQVEITTEFMDFIKFEQEFIDNDYIYFIEPIEEDEQNKDWSGKLSSIKNSMQQQQNNIVAHIENSIKKNSKEMTIKMKENVETKQMNTD